MKASFVVAVSVVWLPGVLSNDSTVAVESKSLDVRAFPGAEGWGAATAGGRGGKVIKVSNLNASGPGSFAEACSTEGPRIVVFEVSGVIRGNIRITKPHITVAGQTAGSGHHDCRHDLKLRPWRSRHRRSQSARSQES